MTVPGPTGPPTPYHVPAPPTEPPVQVPAPPTGPGAAPVFAAPPTEGRTFRMWLGLGLAALAVLLCCGGGFAGIIGLGVVVTEASNEQARVVAGEYFGALTQKQYDKAYGLLCADDRTRETGPEFGRRMAAEPEIASYRVGEATITNQIVVPVDVSYVGAGRRTLNVSLVADSQSGSMRVCGIS